jgi:hypothetical protein
MKGRDLSISPLLDVAEKFIYLLVNDLPSDSLN